LPARIEELERRQAELEQRMAAPGFFAGDPAEVKTTTEAHAAVLAELEAAYSRWDELEEAAG
jgi:ATP-binding cassette subfamily F protein uup